MCLLSLNIVHPALSLISGRNKPRMYIAFYKRAGSKAGDPSFHVAIISRTHPLDDSDNNTLRLHAVNTILAPTATSEAKEIWVFQGKFCRFQTPLLAGLLYLGKLPADRTFEDLQNACEKVHVPMDGAGGFRCRRFVTDALKVCTVYCARRRRAIDASWRQIMQEDGFIPNLPCTPEELWARGRKFVIRNLKTEGVVCCDVQGAEYDSTA